MFQVSLDQMDDRKTELLEFEQKLNRQADRLEEQIRRLEIMDSFPDICIWLRRTEEQLEEQARQVEELGTALESIIRLCLSSEERILEHLEDGTMKREDGTLFFKALERPENWSVLMEF